MVGLRDQDIPIGFGAFKIGRNEGIRYPAGYALPDAATVERLLNGVLDLGVRYIDTAPAYGLSEERIGESIAHRRSEYFLSTKVGETFRDGVSSYDFSRAGVRASVERSLRRLRTDVIDILFVHARRDDVAVVRETQVVEAVCAMRAEGLARYVGFSGYTREAFSACLDWADALMMEYHADDTSLAPMMSEAARRGIAVVVKKGLASGRIPAGRAVSFVLENPDVTSLLVGTLSLAHMRENVELARRVRGRGPGFVADAW